MCLGNGELVVEGVSRHILEKINVPLAPSFPQSRTRDRAADELHSFAQGT